MSKFHWQNVYLGNVIIPNTSYSFFSDPKSILCLDVLFFSDLQKRSCSSTIFSICPLSFNQPALNYLFLYAKLTVEYRHLKQFKLGQNLKRSLHFALHCLLNDSQTSVVKSLNIFYDMKSFSF